MEDSHIFNFFPQSFSLISKEPTRNYSLDEFVNQAVTKEIDNCGDGTLSKTLLLQTKDSLIDYLKNEYLKVPIEQFVGHVCEFTNLDENLSHAFTKIFMALERIAIKMEMNRSVIRTPGEQRHDNDLIEKLKKQKQQIEKDDSPEPPLGVSCQYSPPKSMFDVIVPSVLVERNDSPSHNQALIDDNYESSNQISRNDEIIFVDDDENFDKIPMMNSSFPLSSHHHTDKRHDQFYHDRRQNDSTRSAQSPCYRNPISENNNASFDVNAANNSNKSIVNKSSMPSSRSSFPSTSSSHRRSSNTFDSLIDNEGEEAIQQEPKSCYEMWQKYAYNQSNTDFEEEVIEVLHELRYNSFRPEFKGQKRKVHLNMLSFLEEFVTLLRTAFHPSGPKRYKKNRHPLENSCFNPEIPKLIIVTIPYIDSHPTASTNKHKIISINDALRSYVNKNKSKLFKDYNQIIELYDWEKEAQDFGQCTFDDMESRFKILTTALSEKY
uniref:Uncharacterized protein n=1 Tax=Panagrolaimus sp. ES5 TaxID=591445 RepID=A0AC34FX65_9BILA